MQTPPLPQSDLSVSQELCLKIEMKRILIQNIIVKVRPPIDNEFRHNIAKVSVWIGYRYPNIHCTHRNDPLRAIEHVLVG